MSLKQWETFYWPSFKRLLLRAIELGYTASVFCEGRCDSRLEYFLDMPKGKMLLRFSYTDMKRAKEIVGDHQCIMGNVPSSLLQMGSVSEVEDYCKTLIKDCAKGGGFILRAGTDSIDDAKPENVKAMVDSVKKWGVY
jgi:uroporphyrinogen-III decarboxylase